MRKEALHGERAGARFGLMARLPCCRIFFRRRRLAKFGPLTVRPQQGRTPRRRTLTL